MIDGASSFTALALCACWVFLYAFVVICRLFSELTVYKKEDKIRSTIRVSNGLDPDQDRRSVGPDLGPNCLQRLSAYDKRCSQQGAWDT